MLNMGNAPEGTPVLYSASPGEKFLHVMAEVRVLWREDADRGPESPRDRKARFVLPLTPRGADWVLLEAPPPLVPNPPGGSICRLPPNFDSQTALKDAEETLDLMAPRLCAVRAFSNRHARLLSEAGEDREAFARRCSDALEPLRRAEEELFRKKFKQRIERLREQRERELQKNRENGQEVRLEEWERTINDLEAGLTALFGGRRPAARIRETAADASASGTMRERSQSAGAPGRTADQPMDFIGEQLRDLRAEMDAEARRIGRKYTEMAAEITEETVTPDRRDFRIEQLSLVWIGTNEVH